MVKGIQIVTHVKQRYYISIINNDKFAHVISQKWMVDNDAVLVDNKNIPCRPQLNQCTKTVKITLLLSYYDFGT